jgi:hypothetical protein
MSVEQNKALVRHMVDEEPSTGERIGHVDEFLAPNFVEREVLPPGIPSGREGRQAIDCHVAQRLSRLSGHDRRYVAEGDKVVIRQTWTGTHKGEFMGIPSKLATVFLWRDRHPPHCRGQVCRTLGPDG